MVDIHSAYGAHTTNRAQRAQGQQPRLQPILRPRLPRPTLPHPFIPARLPQQPLHALTHAHPSLHPRRPLPPLGNSSFYNKIIILYLQYKYGPRFFVPKFLLPNYYNYTVKLKLN